MGAEEWAELAPALGACARLSELVDFPWSRALLAPGAALVGLGGAGLGSAEAAVLGALLPRAAATLVALRLGCVLRNGRGERVCRRGGLELARRAGRRGFEGGVGGGMRAGAGRGLWW